MLRRSTLGLTAIAMVAFAANSLLCRFALQHTAIGPAAFTAVRIWSGALTLGLLLAARWPRPTVSQLANVELRGNWPSALALFSYAAAFSYAYTTLTAATGALLLFGAVQLTMMAAGLIRGERLSLWRLAGFVLALSGLSALLWPGLAAPPPGGALLMLGAGVAWGVYSLQGKRSANPLAATAGNFVLAALPATGLALAWLIHPQLDLRGMGYAVLSGAVTSGLGYAVWYAALQGLGAMEAAVVQLSVPVLAAAGAVVFLGESLTMRLSVCAAAILGGIALVVTAKASSAQ